EMRDTERAHAHAQAALELTEERGLLPLSQQAHHLLANASASSEEALAEYDKAIADLEHVQSRLATQLRVEFLGDKLQVFQDAIDPALEARQPHRALSYLERAKSRALVDYLTSHAEVRVQARDPAEQALLDELGVLRNEHHWFYSRLHGLVSDRAAGEFERTALQTAVAEREKQIGRVLERLALLRDAEGLEALGWRHNGHDAEQPKVPPGSVLLEYLLREDRGLVFVVTPDSLHVEQLPDGARAIRRLLGRWQLNVDSVTRALGHRQPIDPLAPNARALLHGLYRALIEPVERYLADAERLVVIPYGAAHGVPFQALFDGHRYVLDYLQVAVCPSSALLELSQRRPYASGRGALVVGNTNGGRLPGVLAEAHAVAGMLDGTYLIEEEATREAVLAEAPLRDVLHVAAHGEARLDNPLFAHINLADGQLGMVDVFNLRLDGALVTLSA